jgi:ABC-type dipeptide/oligopeptide/nickel transport system permease subunit
MPDSPDAGAEHAAPGTFSARTHPRRERWAGEHGRKLSRLARRNLIGVLGAAIVMALMLVALFAGQISPFDPNTQVGKRLVPPGGLYLLGLDQLGRDVFSRLIFGARVALGVCITSVGAALLVGVSLGVLAGYYGGMTDNVIMRVMDLLFTLPSFVMALVLAGILGPSLLNVMIAIALVTTPSIARIARGPVLIVRESEFVTSARIVGARDRRIMFRHVLPNILAPIIVQTTVSMADAILIEAGLSFLGLGVVPPDTSWGNMLGVGRSYMELANGLSVFPGAAIMLAVLGFNFAGDGLRDLLDPRLRGV